MSILEEVQVKLALLSVEELLALQEQIIGQLRVKARTQNAEAVSQATPIKKPDLVDLIPGAYRPTKEQIEAHLAAVFSPEELAATSKVDITKLPPLPRSITEIVSEGREDRLLPDLLIGKTIENRENIS